MLYFCVDWQETYTEVAGMQRFGAFYMDYLYTVEHSRGKGVASLDLQLLLLKQQKIKAASELVGPWHTIFHSIPFIFRYFGGKGLILVL